MQQTLNGGRHCCRPPLHHHLPVRCRTSGDWHGASSSPKTFPAPGRRRLAAVPPCSGSRRLAGPGSA
jgi:hypothetical protein